MAVWTDASSLATGVVLESADGDVIEDACWLRHNEATHINMAELDAANRGVNLAVAWGARTIDLRTDSATVHRWLDDAISGRARLRTKAHGELMIRRRVGIICQLVGELRLRLSVTLVRSAENRADALTRVPKDWLRNVSVTRECESPSPGVSAAVVSEPPPLAGAAAGRADSGTADELCAAVCQSHDRAGHPGVRRTLYFARRDVSRDVTRAMARAVVENCDACRSIDPAPVRWRHGSLGVSVPWQRISIDVTHHRGQNYLTVIDCGPSRFCVWRSLRRANANEIVGHLEQLFLERGAPEEILTDNDTVFRGRHMAVLAARWRVALRFRAVHEPGGNGVVERCHRTIKVIAARRQCTVAEAVHIYNVTPRDGVTAESAPASGVYQYTVRDCIRSAPSDAAEASERHSLVSDDRCRVRPPLSDATEAVGSPPLVSDGARLRVGDRVWVRRRGTRCTDMSRRGTVTGLVSRQVVEVDGVPWHVRNVRHRCDRQDSDGDSDSVDDGDGDSDSVDDGPPLYVDCHWEATEDGADAVVDNGTTVRAVPETLQHATEQTGTEPPAAEPAVAEPPAAEPAQVEPVLLRRSARLQSRMVR